MDLFLGPAFQDRGLGTDAVRTMARYLMCSPGWIGRAIRGLETQ